MAVPKEMREALKMGDETQLNIFVVGQCLMLTPKRLTRSALAVQVERNMKEQDLSLESLLADLKTERKRTLAERYAG